MRKAKGKEASKPIRAALVEIFAQQVKMLSATAGG